MAKEQADAANQKRQDELAVEQQLLEQMEKDLRRRTASAQRAASRAAALSSKSTAASRSSSGGRSTPRSRVGGTATQPPQLSLVSQSARRSPPARSARGRGARRSPGGGTNTLAQRRSPKGNGQETRATATVTAAPATPAVATAAPSFAMSPILPSSSVKVFTKSQGLPSPARRGYTSGRSETVATAVKHVSGAEGLGEAGRGERSDRDPPASTQSPPPSPSPQLLSSTPAQEKEHVLSVDELAAEEVKARANAMRSENETAVSPYCVCSADGWWMIALFPSGQSKGSLNSC